MDKDEHFAKNLLNKWKSDVFIGFAVGWFGGVCLMALSLSVLLTVLPWK